MAEREGALNGALVQLNDRIRQTYNAAESTLLWMHESTYGEEPVSADWTIMYMEQIRAHLDKLEAAVHKTRIRIAVIKFNKVGIQRLPHTMRLIVDRRRYAAFDDLVSMGLNPFEARYVYQCGTLVVHRMESSHGCVKTKWARIVIGMRRLMEQHVQPYVQAPNRPN